MKTMAHTNLLVLEEFPKSIGLGRVWLLFPVRHTVYSRQQGTNSADTMLTMMHCLHRA